MCTVMGTLFLILILELCRAYAKNEVDNCRKTSRLPLDHFWAQLGQVTNMAAVFFTAMCMPVLFWGELAPKDIVFDALGLMFIFELDDLAGSASAFLGMDDAGFKQMAAWFFALLTRCPVHLRDVTNPNARHPSEVWQLRASSTGVCSADTGKACAVRISSIDTESSPLMPTGNPVAEGDCDTWLSFKGCASAMTCGMWSSSPLVNLWRRDSAIFKANSFKYVVSATAPAATLPCGSWKGRATETLWVLLWLLLALLEVAFPLLFFTLNKPCTVR